jgi:antitoxin (DNA-binding transcriptional repressor) of toxin-antitoxin stability system
MKAVGVKQLKARLSEYLRLVQRGETLLLTHRDEVIAEIRPARRGAGLPDETEALLDALAESGDVTRARLPKQGWAWKARGLGLPSGTADRLLDDLRAERGSF